MPQRDLVPTICLSLHSKPGRGGHAQIIGKDGDLCVHTRQFDGSFFPSRLSTGSSATRIPSSGPAAYAAALVNSKAPHLRTFLSCQKSQNRFIPDFLETLEVIYSIYRIRAIVKCSASLWLAVVSLQAGGLRYFKATEQMAGSQ